jgi:hypothetical protein
VKRSDRKQWRAARTLADLGELTARWLEGDLRSQPGYMPNCGPDDETTRLVGTLATACRSGFLTEVSQPGKPLRAGYDGAMWQQRAAVSGFVADEELLDRIFDAADAAGLEVIAHPPADGSDGWTPEPLEGRYAVTTRDGRPFTGFGGFLDESEIAERYDACHPEALRAVAAAWQVTVIDPVWGRDGALWPLLDDLFADAGRCQSPDALSA